MTVYVPVEMGFARHPKTQAFKRLLQDRLADAYLVRLWEWSMTYAPDGDLNRFTDDEIADAVEFPEGGVRLVSALLGSGYICSPEHCPEDASRHLHGWSEAGRGGALMRTRAMTAARSRKYRETKGGHGPSRTPSRSVTPRHATGEGREGEGREGEGSGELPLARLASSALDGFDRFWSLYPRKVSKGHARKAWEKLKPNTGLADRIVAAVEDQKTWPRGNGLNKAHDADGNGGNPHPATWLRGERWEDKAPAGHRESKKRIESNGTDQPLDVELLVKFAAVYERHTGSPPSWTTYQRAKLFEVVRIAFKGNLAAAVAEYDEACASRSASPEQFYNTHTTLEQS